MKNKDLYVHIAYIAYRLITGRKIISLLNTSESGGTDMTGHLDSALLKEFDQKHQGYVPGFAGNCTYSFTASTGSSFDIFINRQNFVLHIKGSSAYFIGNIWNDTIYLHDHRSSGHCKYKILKCVEEEEKVVKH